MISAKSLPLSVFIVVLLTILFMKETMAKDYKAGMNRVEFKSGGVKIVGTLFLPPDYKKGARRLPAIIVDGPWTQVKEQVGYRYAAELAKNGFAALAFDHRYWGESAGFPRSFESPAAKIEDLENAVAFLQKSSAIDANKIGGLGICFGASYIAMLAAEDTRIKSIATIAAWLHDPESIRKLYGEERYNRYLQDGQAALADFKENGKVKYVPAFSSTDNHAAMFIPDPVPPMDYYAGASRGVIPQWKNEFAAISWVDWLNLDAIGAVAPHITQPILMVHSDNSALPENVRKFYSLVKSPKELYWTEGFHLDFYDKDKEVGDAAQAVIKHFRKTLTNETSFITEQEKNRAAVERFFERLEAMDIKGFIEVWDERGVQEMPFAPEGFPKRVDGREAIFNQYKGLPENYTGMIFPRTIRATDDPQIFFVEYKGIINVKATDKPYNNDYVGKFEVVNGKIVRFTEYFNPIILQQAFGGDLQKNFNVEKKQD